MTKWMGKAVDSSPGLTVRPHGPWTSDGLFVDENLPGLAIGNGRPDIIDSEFFQLLPVEDEEAALLPAGGRQRRAHQRAART